MADEDSSFRLHAYRELPLSSNHTWEEYVAAVDARLRELMETGRYAELLGDFEETHRGEPFVMHD